MAWTLRGNIEGGYESSTGNVTSTGNGGVQPGDLVVIVTASNQHGEDWGAASAGFSKMSEYEDVTFTNGPSSALFIKVAGTSEPSTYEFEPSTGHSAGRGLRGAVFNPNGAHIVVDDVSVLADTTFDQVHSTGSVTVVGGVDNVGLLVVCGANNSSVTIDTPPTDMTLVDEVLNNTTTPDLGDISLAMYYNLAQAPGAVTKEFDWSVNSDKVAFAFIAHLVDPSVNNPISTSAATVTSVTIDDYTLGAEDDKILVVVGACHDVAGAGPTLSATFNGNAMTKVVEGAVHPSFSYRIAIFEMVGASGVGDIVVTKSGAAAFAVTAHACYLSGVTGTASVFIENDGAPDTTTPFLISIGPGLVETAPVVYGAVLHSGNFDITVLTASGLTALTDEFPASGTGYGMGYEFAGASGSESGGWTHDGTGGELSGLLAAASWGLAAEGRTVTDGIKLGDSAITGDAARSASDGLKLGDLAQGNQPEVASASDGLKLGENMTTTFGDDSGPDGVKLGDTLAAQTDYAITAASGLLLGDEASGELSRLVTDGLFMGDEATATQDLGVATTDGLKLGDTAQSDFSGQVLDGLKLGDSATEDINLGISATSGLLLGDAATAVGVGLASDGIKLGEVLTEELTQSGRSALDGMRLGEAILLRMGWTASITDGLRLGDGTRWPAAGNNGRGRGRGRTNWRWLVVP